MIKSDLIEHRNQLADFVSRYEGKRLFSTSAQVIKLSSDLYNVSGSTNDPKVPGSTSWMGLLIAYQSQSSLCTIDVSECYVTGPGASGGNHPAFEVGGHMTTDSTGAVAKGGSCYLMPLCKWHNSTSKNGIAFTHSETCMLQLAGYLEAEPAATFMARFDAREAAALVYLSGEGLAFRALPEAGAEIFGDARIARSARRSRRGQRASRPCRHAPCRGGWRDLLPDCRFAHRELTGQLVASANSRQ